MFNVCANCKTDCHPEHDFCSLECRDEWEEEQEEIAKEEAYLATLD